MFGIDDMALATVMSSIGSGIMGSNAQDEANRRNLQEAAANRRFQAESRDIQNVFNAEQSAAQRLWGSTEAVKNREFQERMSSTAYQRSVADLKAAGLNPILAVGNAGASTPGGSLPSGSAASSSGVSGSQGRVEASTQLSESLNKATASALQLKGLEQSLKSIESQVELNEKLKATQDAIKRNNDASAKKAEAETSWTWEKAKQAAFETPAVKEWAEADKRRGVFEQEPGLQQGKAWMSLFGSLFSSARNAVGMFK